MKGTFIASVLLIIMVVPVLSAQEAQDCPCCAPEYRGFDFWIGNWEVTLADGSPAGVNQVEKIQGGCVLQEHWTSARRGFTGTSFTYYNRDTGKWEQLWVDNGGSILKLTGGLRGGAMVLTSEPVPAADGTPAVNRITWSLREDGSVRQLWEVLSDGVVTQVLFDGYYRKAPE